MKRLLVRPFDKTVLLSLHTDALCNERWDEGWQDQLRWNRQARAERQRCQQQQRFTQRQSTQSPDAAPVITPSPQPEPPQPPLGRTQAHYRWGRYTFSSRMLRQGGLAKK